MTIYDYLMTMKKVKIAELKARLSEHLRYVRGGPELTVLNRSTPLARISPYEQPASVSVRKPLGLHDRLQDVPLPPPRGLAVDVGELLLEDRESRR